MKRLSVTYRPEALADIRGIYAWVAERSGDLETAKRFADRLAKACEKIGDRPSAGRARDDLAPGLRTFAFERRAVIAYFAVEDAVQIVKILYRGRDVDAFFRAQRTEEN